jgi:hypothetical protein
MKTSYCGGVGTDANCGGGGFTARNGGLKVRNYLDS